MRSWHVTPVVTVVLPPASSAGSASLLSTENRKKGYFRRKRQSVSRRVYLEVFRKVLLKIYLQLGWSPVWIWRSHTYFREMILPTWICCSWSNDSFRIFNDGRADPARSLLMWEPRGRRRGSHNRPRVRCIEHSLVEGEQDGHFVLCSKLPNLAV